MKEISIRLPNDCAVKVEQVNYRNRVDFVNSFINHQHFECILDVGAGGLSPNIPRAFRPMARHISRAVGQTRYMALELDPFKANRLQAEFCVNNVYVGDLATFRPDRPVDVIYAGLVFQSIPRIEVVLDNICGFLSPNGWIVVDCPNLYWWQSIVYFLRKDLLRTDQNPYHRLDSTWATLVKTFHYAGFRVEEVSYIGGLRDSLILPSRFREFIGIKAQRI
jgi:hypothetical protein